MRACACDPRMSTDASRTSKLIDSVNVSTRGSVFPSNLPPHAFDTISLSEYDRELDEVHNNTIRRKFLICLEFHIDRSL
jgi:hypothetical protein